MSLCDPDSYRDSVSLCVISFFVTQSDTEEAQSYTEIKPKKSSLNGYSEISNSMAGRDSLSYPVFPADICSLAFNTAIRQGKENHTLGADLGERYSDLAIADMEDQH